MTPADLETTYELLATNLDQFDEAVVPLYLAKVALLMATKIDDMETISECITAAASELDKSV